MWKTSQPNIEQQKKCGILKHKSSKNELSRNKNEGNR